MKIYTLTKHNCSIRSRRKLIKVSMPVRYIDDNYRSGVFVTKIPGEFSFRFDQYIPRIISLKLNRKILK